MGFLDKLLNAFQKPLTDPTEKQYYEIAFNLLRVIRAARYPVIKKYVDFKIGTPCDEELLKRALVYIKQNRQADGEVCYLNSSDESDLIAVKNPEIYEISKEIIKRVPYAEICLLKEQAYCVCYDDEINQVKSEIAKVLNMPLENACKVFLNQAIGKIKTDLKCNDFLLYIAFKQSFFEDTGVKEAVLQHYFNVLERRAKEKNVPVYFSGMALRTVNFEKSGEIETGYQTFSNSECEKYLKGHNAFIGQPIGRYVDSVKKASAFYDEKTYQIFDLKNFWDACSKDDYFMDTVCYSGWLKIKAQYDDEATTINEMADMIYDFALNHAS